MAKLLTTNHGGGELLLCLDVDCDPGLEVYCEVILEDGDLGNVRVCEEISVGYNATRQMDRGAVSALAALGVTRREARCQLV